MTIKSTSGAHTTILTTTLTVGLVPLNSTLEEAYTVQGIKKDFNYNVWFDSMDAGVVWTTGRGTADNQLTIRYINTTAGNITPGALTAHIVDL